MSRPRIAFISPQVPYPQNSGTKIRIYHLLRALAEIGDVDFVAYATEAELLSAHTRTTDQPPWHADLRSAHLLQHPFWPESNPRRYARALQFPPSRAEDVYYSSYPAAPLRAYSAPLLACADLIWVERLTTANAFADVANKTIVDLDDLEAVKVSRRASGPAPMWLKRALRRESQRLARKEQWAADRYARVVVCSDTDAQLLSNGPRPAWVIPNGVDDSLLSRVDTHAIPNRLLFVGTMNYPPNEDAALYFVDHILPLVMARIPETTLAIVGLNPSARIRALHDGRRIFVHANVPDVAPFVRESTLSVVPLRVGGGTRLKILESLALGTPVLSTGVGAEGLNLVPGQHLLLADNPAQFAAEAVRLLREPGLRHDLIEAGRARVVERYLWTAIRREVGGMCAAWLEQRRGTRE